MRNFRKRTYHCDASYPFTKWVKQMTGPAATNTLEAGHTSVCMTVLFPVVAQYKAGPIVTVAPASRVARHIFSGLAVSLEPILPPIVLVVLSYNCEGEKVLHKQ